MPTGNMVMFSILVQILKELLCILTFHGHQTLEFCLLRDDQELIWNSKSFYFREWLWTWLQSSAAFVGAISSDGVHFEPFHCQCLCAKYDLKLCWNFHFSIVHFWRILLFCNLHMPRIWSSREPHEGVLPEFWVFDKQFRSKELPIPGI